MKKTTLKRENKILIPTCWVAKDFYSRLRGLMGKKNLPADEAILFPKCNSIHTFFMRFPIDVVLVSKEGRVVDIVEGMKGWRFLTPRKGVKHVIEMKAERCRELGISKGNQLQCEGVWLVN